MANDCFFRPFQKVVNNKNLEYLGMLKIHFDAGTTVVSDTDYTQIMLVFSADTTIVMKNVTGGCHFTNFAGTANYGTERTITGDNTQKVALITKGTCDLLIPKKNFLGFFIGSTSNNGADRITFSIDGLSYYPDFNLLVAGFNFNKCIKDLSGDIQALSGDSITRLAIPSSSVVGDVTSMMAANHSTLTTVNLYNTDIRFDMSVLNQYSFPNINHFLLPNDIVNGDIEYLGNLDCDVSFRELSVSHKIHGTIESYAAKRANVFGAGSCTISYAGDFNKVTYNETPLSIIFNSTDSPTLTWDASGNITSFE